MSLADRDSYYGPLGGDNPPSPSSKISFSHNIAALIEGGNDNNGKEVVPNPGNEEQSKTKESRKWRSLEGADAPSENTNPTKKPRIKDDHRIHLQVDDETLDETDFEHKTPQLLGEPISSELTNLLTKYWKYEPSNFSTIKKLQEKILIPENCEEICVPKLNRDIFFGKDFQPWIKGLTSRSVILKQELLKPLPPL